MTKSFLVFTILFFFLFGCSTDAVQSDVDGIENEETRADGSDEQDGSEQEQEQEGVDNTDTDTEPVPNTPITTNLRTYIFGHSLIVHDPPAIATPSNETTVPHWVAELAASSSFDYAISGQYGFLRNHANLPPVAQWGFDRAQGAWDSDTEAFRAANFNSILITAGNFIQYQSASIPFDGNNPDGTTPIGATLEIFDWVEEQEPGVAIYIYENWPDMGSFLSNGVPASVSEFENYNNYTLNEFHDWWLGYLMEVVMQRPDLNVKMIPVGPIISKLLTETELSNIPFSELYEDDAPHGRPSIYFLASLITYMAMYGTEAPTNFEVPETVHAIVRENYAVTVDFIWQELNNFNDSAGNNMVFQ